MEGSNSCQGITNQWDNNWTKSWFYVKGDQDEVAFHQVAIHNSGRDLVEDFVACGIWTLSHSWSKK
ncbi:hypothetical protein ACJX0J_034035, partial [Zea mays]